MTARGTVDKVRIARWLKRQGLGQYARAFKEHNIGFDVLPGLGDEDLKELGVPLGDRKRLLKAIADLQMSLESAGDAIISAAARRPPICRVDPERRQLTLLFCDLVATTELSARLDPEDLREVVHAYQARVGVATGMAVVGDLIGEGGSREAAVVGDVPNLAARMQAVAAPNTVVISDSTRRLVGGLFELDDVGPQRLKGFAEPLAVWRVSGESRIEGRLEARQPAGVTPLVGREEEIALLLRHWRQARDGEGQVVLLAGEPGIGKSRLVRELRERIAAEPHLRLAHQCSPYHQTSPLHPMIEHLERAAGFERDDPPEARLAKLEALLARGTDKLDQAVPLIAALLGIPTGERYPALELTPQRQKQLTLEALLHQLAGLAAEQPVLVVHEDIHWIDPTTLELLGLAIERINRLPVLVVITFRPEFQPPWMGGRHLTLLTLNRLSRRQGATMVERVTGKMLPPDVVGQ